MIVWQFNGRTAEADIVCYASHVVADSKRGGVFTCSCGSVVYCNIEGFCTGDFDRQSGQSAQAHHIAAAKADSVDDEGAFAGIGNAEFLTGSIAYVQFAEVMFGGSDGKDRILYRITFKYGNVIHIEIVVAIALGGFCVEGEVFDAGYTGKRNVEICAGGGNRVHDVRTAGIVPFTQDYGVGHVRTVAHDYQESVVSLFANAF